MAEGWGCEGGIRWNLGDCPGPVRGARESYLGSETYWRSPPAVLLFPSARVFPSSGLCFLPHVPGWLVKRCWFVATMNESLKSFIKRWIITTLAVLVAAQVVKGIRYDNFESLVIATLTLGLLNAFLRPILLLLSLPLLVFTLGLFTWVINAGLLMLVGRLFSGFHVEEFRSALWGALVISIVSILLNLLTGGTRVKASVSVGGASRDQDSRKRRLGSDDDGPVIDV